MGTGITVIDSRLIPTMPPVARSWDSWPLVPRHFKFSSTPRRPAAQATADLSKRAIIVGRGPAGGTDPRPCFEGLVFKLPVGHRSAAPIGVTKLNPVGLLGLRAWCSEPKDD